MFFGDVNFTISRITYTSVYFLLKWGYHLETIFNLRKKAIRAMTCIHYKAHTDPLFK